jgi:hypothetical protein
MSGEMNEEMLNEMLRKLAAVTEILTKEIPVLDMDVSDWNQTPIGRAVSGIEEVCDMIQEAEL